MRKISQLNAPVLYMPTVPTHKYINILKRWISVESIKSAVLAAIVADQGFPAKQYNATGAFRIIYFNSK